MNAAIESRELDDAVKHFAVQRTPAQWERAAEQAQADAQRFDSDDGALRNCRKADAEFCRRMAEISKQEGRS